ncbi:MAG TPA: AAA family ATPase [Chloroflexota bacterium]
MKYPPKPSGPFFGAVLRHYRLAAHLTQEELAARARVSRITVSALERGTRRVPHRDTLLQLADALSLSTPARQRFEAAAWRTGRVSPGVAEVSAHAPGSVRSSPLVGRNREMHVLERHIEGTETPLLALSGEPGVGKTRLLQEAFAYAALCGQRVLASSCGRWRKSEPFAPVIEALSQHIRSYSAAQRQHAVQSHPFIVRLLPELRPYLSEELPPLNPQHDRRLIGDAVGQFVFSPEPETGDGSTGTILVLDDAHWADADTIDLLTRLARTAFRSPGNSSCLRLLISYRDSELDSRCNLSLALSDLQSSCLVSQLPVCPLGDDESRELLGRLLPNADDHTIQSIIRHENGLPFSLLSWARAIQSQMPLGDEGVPPELLNHFRTRIAALPKGSQEVLHVIAVMGSAVTLRTLSALVERSPDQIIGCLNDALRAGILNTKREECSLRFVSRAAQRAAEVDLGDVGMVCSRERYTQLLDGIDPDRHEQRKCTSSTEWTTLRNRPISADVTATV